MSRTESEYVSLHRFKEVIDNDHLDVDGSHEFFEESGLVE
jgi:hypothetical protein